MVGAAATGAVVAVVSFVEAVVASVEDGEAVASGFEAAVLDDSLFDS